jgi:hypothetical protein
MSTGGAGAGRAAAAAAAAVAAASLVVKQVNFSSATTPGMFQV